MKNKEPLVCFVILTYRDGQKIIDCLTSLKLTNYSNYKVILINNNEANGEKLTDLKSIIPDIDIINMGKATGHSYGANHGIVNAIKKYNPKYICKMDSDIITIQPDWLSLQIKELEKKKINAISAGKLVFLDNRLQLLWYTRDFKNFSEYDNGQYDFIKIVPAVGGALIIFKTSMFKDVGIYDENYFYGPDDLDICLRAGKKGYKIIYNGLSKSIHIGSSSYHSFAPKERTQTFNAQCYGNLLFRLRHQGKKSWIKCILLQFIRVFITKKASYSQFTFNNIYFHYDFPLRFFYLLSGIYYSIKNKNCIINSQYNKNI